MKKSVLPLLIVLACIGVPGIVLRITARPGFTHWQVSPAEDKAAFWTPFLWSGDNDSSGVMRRKAMFIPVRVEGIPRTLYFQFDLGSDYTMFYERSARDVFAAYPGCPYKNFGLR